VIKNKQRKNNFRQGILFMKNPFEIEREATDYWTEEIEKDIENVRFFNHEMYKYDILKKLYPIIDAHLKKEYKIGIDRIIGFANKKNGSEESISDYEHACMYCYAVYTRINVVNRIKFMMELLSTTRINVLTMLAGHLYAKISDNVHYTDWYYERYLDAEWEVEKFFQNKYGSFISPRKRGNK